MELPVSVCFHNFFSHLFFPGVANTGGALLGKVISSSFHSSFPETPLPAEGRIHPRAFACVSLLFSAGVICVYLAGYLIETTGSWISVFNLVAAVNSIGLCTFLLFGEAQRVDTDSVYVDL